MPTWPENTSDKVTQTGNDNSLLSKLHENVHGSIDFSKGETGGWIDRKIGDIYFRA